VSKRLVILAYGCLLGCLLETDAWGADGAHSVQVLVDRPRLEQKLRRIADAIAGAKERLKPGDPVMKELLDDAQAQLEQARVQLRSERSAEAWLEQQLEARQTSTPADAGIVPNARDTSGSLRPADPFVSNLHVEKHPTQAATPLPAGREPLGEVAMRSLVNAMRGETFREGKLEVLRQAAPAYVFDVPQIVELLNEVVAPSDRLEVLKLTVPHLVDKTQLPQLFRACSNEDERSVVRQLVES
jgi:hypothetical protein